jgi:hypothetical protein
MPLLLTYARFSVRHNCYWRLLLLRHTPIQLRRERSDLEFIAMVQQGVVLHSETGSSTNRYHVALSHDHLPILSILNTRPCFSQPPHGLKIQI